MEIKDIDACIIRELLIDGRTEFTTIANKCGVYERIIWSRYKALKKAEIIVGVTSQVNFRKCGQGIITNFKIHMDPNNRENALKKIRELPEIHFAMKGIQNYFLIVVMLVKSLNEIDKIRNKLSTLTSAKKITSEIWIEVKNIPENLEILSEKKTSRSLNKKTVSDDLPFDKIGCKLDKIDSELIELLTTNGRMSFRAISKKIGKSHDTISKRYKKLVEKKLMKVIIQINPIKIGYNGWMVISLLFSSNISLSEKINEIIKMPNIIHLVKTKGPFDLEIMVFIKDLHHLYEMQEKISKIKGLTRIKIQNFKIPDFWPLKKQHKSTF